MRLLVRLKPDAESSLLGYALALTEANGLNDLRWLLTAARLPRSFATKECDLGPLAAAVDHLVNVEELKSISIWPLATRSNIVRFGRQEIAASGLDMIHAKVCVSCLREGKSCKRIWDLRCYLACPEHNEILTDTCNHCGSRLSWYRRSPRVCRCGKEIASSNLPVPREVLDIARAIANFAGSTLNRFHGIAPVVGLDAAVRLLWFAGTHTPGLAAWRSMFIAKPRLMTALDVVQRGAPVLLDWPHGLRNWLKEHRRPGFGGLVATFGPLMERMRVAFDHPGLEQILDEIRCTLASDVNGLPVKHWSFFYANPPFQKTHVTAAVAARQLGVTNASIGKMILDGRLSGASQTMGTRHIRLIDCQHLGRILDERASSLGSREAGRWLGVSAFQIETFRRIGLLTAARYVGKRSHEYRFHIDDLDAFRIRLEDAAVSKHSSVDHIRLANVPELRRVRLVDLVSAVFQGILKLVADDSSGKSSPVFQRLLVSKDAIFGTRFTLNGASMSVAAAAKRLSVSVRMIPLLVEHGCLERIEAHNQSIHSKCSISAVSVNGFHGRFALSSRLAREFRTSTRVICERLKAAGVEPLIHSHSAKGISAVWKLSELNAIDLSKRQATS
ncbi:TniQ family protein [Microvirga soli]|uniref:TniQ family protein n=1 Tax=Microvirga soli TaxID=1854496 RepID=UPI00191FD9EC|nr:TniQ family protein [Microvirga soli]